MKSALHLALLASTLALSSAASGEIQLLPAGQFSARDGRPGPGASWSIDDSAGERIAAQLNTIAAKTPIVIDYEHQTLNAETNGQAAPAAGWMHHFEWRKGVGLFSTGVEWTERAKGYIAAGEYRYISPVIAFDKSGAVKGVLNAALVNFPALLGMEPVMARLRAFSSDQQSQESLMNPLLAKLVALFGLATATTDEQLVAHLTTLKTVSDNNAQQLASLRTALGLDDKADLAACAAQVATLKATIGKPDASLAAMVATQQTQLAALTAKLEQRDLDALVDGAIEAGKFVPAQREHLMNMGKTNLAYLKTFIDGQPAIAKALGDGQSGGDGNARSQAAGGLNTDELAVCKAMGMTPDEFKAG